LDSKRAMAAKRQKLVQLAPPLSRENGHYKIDLPFGGNQLFESHNDALRAKIPADAAIAVGMELDRAMKRWVVSMAAAALKQRGDATVTVTKMLKISEAAMDALLDRATSQRCASDS
jgi:hypothetical protein